MFNPRTCLAGLCCCLLLSCKSGFTAVNYRTDIDPASFSKVAVLPFDLSMQKDLQPGAAEKLRAEFIRQLAGLGYSVRSAEAVDSALKDAPVSGKADASGMKRAALILKVDGFAFARLSYQTGAADRTVREHLRIDLVAPDGNEIWSITLVDERDFENAMVSLKRQMQESSEK